MKALELKKEYETKLDELAEKRLAIINKKVEEYRNHLLETDMSFADEAKKIHLVLDEIDKVIAEEDVLAKRLDTLASGEIKEAPIVEAPIEEPAVEDIPVEEPAAVEEPAPAEEVKPSELRRPGMMSIFRR